MRVKLSSLAFAALMSVSSFCAQAGSEVPAGKYFGASSQLRIASAHHWDVIARDVASRISDKVPKTNPIFVYQPDSNVFDKVFYDAITSALVSQGYVVVLSTGEGVLELSMRATVVPFDSKASKHPTGVPTLLATGVAAIHNIAVGGEPILAGLMAVAGADVGRSVIEEQRSSRTELAVAVGITSGMQYVFHETNVYYVHDQDRMLFAEPLVPRIIEVTAE